MMKGAILVGGASSRMGRPKAGLVVEDRTLLEVSIAILKPLVHKISLVGRMPEELAINSGIADPDSLERLDDVPDVRGPLAGLVAVLESDSNSDWIILACDMPGMTRDAINWLLDNRNVASHATVGLLSGANSPEPLPVIYGRSAGPLLREFIGSDGSSLRAALGHLSVQQLTIPEHLRACWTNVNTPQDWDSFSRKKTRDASLGD